MKIKFLLVLFAFVISQNISATPVETLNSCKSIFNFWTEAHSFINEYRQSHILPLEAHEAREESGFLKIGKLGQSTSQVYLAVDPITNNSVVLKTSSSLPMFWRELLVTEYLLDNGEIVPKILKAFIKKDGTAVIVREYFKGLTGTELEKERESTNVNVPSTLSVDAWNQLDLERSRLKSLFWKGKDFHLPFARWYSANELRMTQKYRDNWNIIKRMISQGRLPEHHIYDVLFMQDFGRRNLLFNTQLNKWIAYDP